MSEGGQKNLTVHLSFIKKVLKKVENTNLEETWKQLKDLIITTERLSMDKILLIENTLTALKETLKSYENIYAEQTNNAVQTLSIKSKTKIKNKKSMQKDAVKSPIKLFLSKKYATMASPKRERIPPLKINMKEIIRIRKLKREKKMKKRLKLLIIRKGQSFKRELVSPPHSKEINGSNNDNMVVSVNNQPHSNQNVMSKNYESTIEKYGIKDCWISLEKLPQTASLESENHLNTTSIESKISPILLKKTTPNKSSNVHRKSMQNSSSPKTNIPSIHVVQDEAISLSDETLTNLTLNQKIKKEVEKSPPMVSIPTNLVIPLLKKSNAPLVSAESTVSKLRPWLKFSDHQKDANFCEKMLKNDLCLAALYKCMGSTCCFYTNDMHLFQQHMRIHWENQKEEAKNLFQCPYCNFKNENSYLEFIDHVSFNHGCCRYQCAYCFYRSFDYHIVTHMKTYHSQELECTIKCKPSRILNPKKELSVVWENIFSNCRKLTCVVCKEKFFSIKHYQNHFESHASIPPSQCIKCKLQIKCKENIIAHLKHCHQFGNYNCAFCKFGTDKIETLKIHLANEHGNKFLFFFDRNYQSSNVEEQSKKQLVVKQLTLQLNSRWIVKSFPPGLLENAMNVYKNLEKYSDSDIKIEPGIEQRNEI